MLRYLFYQNTADIAGIIQCKSLHRSILGLFKKRMLFHKERYNILIINYHTLFHYFIQVENLKFPQNLAIQ